MKFELVTPEQRLANLDAVEVRIPGEEGDFGVLEGHQPLLSTLRPGTVVVVTAKEEKRFSVGYGFADVSPVGVTVMAEEAVAAENIDLETAQKRVAELTETISDLLGKSPDLVKGMGDEELSSVYKSACKEKTVLEAQLVTKNSQAA